MFEPLRLAGISPGLAMDCSLKEFLQGFRPSHSTSPDPANQLPFIPNGQTQ
jgi:hypothetical protein